jgi:hypothetical protein
MEVSRPPMTYQSVSVVIVLRGWENQPHGEGSQLVSLPLVENNRMITRMKFRECWRNEKGPKSLRRGPCAVKVARTVPTGGMGKHRAAVRPVPTHSHPPDQEVDEPLG